MMCLLKHIMIKFPQDIKHLLMSSSIAPSILGTPPSVNYSQRNFDGSSLATTSQPWFLDIEVTRHLTGDKSVLQAHMAYAGNELVILGNGLFIPTSNTGHSFLTIFLLRIWKEREFHPREELKKDSISSQSSQISFYLTIKILS